MGCSPGSPCNPSPLPMIYAAYPANCADIPNGCCPTSKTVYDGPNLPNTGIDNKDIVSVAFDKIDDALNPTTIVQNFINIVSANPPLAVLFCDLVGNCGITTTSTTTSTTTAAPLPLRLLYSDINDSYIPDPENVNDWNDGFNLPDYGTPFTSVVVDGNEVFLYGGSNITLWYDIFGDVDYILEIDDQAGCITALTNGCLEYGRKTYVSLPGCTIAGNDAFYGNDLLTYLNMPNLVHAGDYMFASCEILTTFNFPSLKFIGSFCFTDCYAMTTMYIPECILLGPNEYDDGVFYNIIGNNITLTISMIVATNNGGGADGDVTILEANNTVTLVIV